MNKPTEHTMTLQFTEHTMTLQFRRLLSESEWREVVEAARQLPYVKGLWANSITPRDSLETRSDLARVMWMAISQDGASEPEEIAELLAILRRYGVIETDIVSAIAAFEEGVA